MLATRFNQYTGSVPQEPSSVELARLRRLIAQQEEELRAAIAHTEDLETRLLGLKDNKRELIELRGQHAKLRRSAQGRIASLLSSPARLLRREKLERVAETDYERWFERHRTTASEIAELRVRAKKFDCSPLVSVLMASFDGDPAILRDGIASVRAQVYENWELIIVDDGSTKAGVADCLRAAARADSRIRVFFEEHRGIAASTNSALSRANGEWIGLLDHDDLLEPDAIFRMLETLQTDRAVDVLYSDGDKVVDGRFTEPMLKPDWSPELFESYAYVSHFVLIRREQLDSGFRTDRDGAQDYDLLLRIAANGGRFRHVPRMLHHWRRSALSTSDNVRRKPGALEMGRRTVEDSVRRLGHAGRVVVDLKTQAYRVRREIGSAKISILVVDGSDADAERIAQRTQFENCEILAGSLAETLASATGDYFLFLDPQLVPIDEMWLEALGEVAANPAVGATGARIVSADEAIVSAGLVLADGGAVLPAFAGRKRDDANADRRLRVIRNGTAVSASCLLTPRAIFERLGGFGGAQAWPVCAGVDYCLRLREAGLRTVVTPYADLRGDAKSDARCPELAIRWPQWFQSDPNYHPHLSREHADFSPGN